MGSAGQNGFHDTALARGPGVILGRSGASFGQAHYCEKDFWPHNTALYVTDFRGNDPLFVFYFLKSIDFTRHNSGGAQQSLNRNFIYPIPVGVPRPPEQRAIAGALSDVDALIGALDQLIAKKQDLKQAAMQQLLSGHQRLPGFHGEWQVKRLGDIAHIKTGSRNNEDKVADGQYPFFVRSETVERINSYSHDCEAILIPGEGRIGSIFHYIHGRFDVHQRVYAITQFKPDISARFVHFYMSKNFGAWAMQNTVKATVDSLRLPTFQTFEMQLPPTLAEQTAIAEVLSDMDAELEALEQRRDKTRALKQGMMQELLTGRVRLR
jgi:type I restriction enzyme S subunit